MTANKLLVATSLLVASMTGIAAEHVRASSEPEASTTEAATLVTGCVIRFTSTGPAILDDANHRCTGATSVSVLTNGDLQIRTPRSGPIVSLTADEDETLTTRGIMAGASGQGEVTIVRFYSTRTGSAVRADSTTLQGSTSNIWMTWVHSV